MGFLDKKSRVVDFVLTERGKRLFATGQLDFTYFSLFDDGIDYAASGSEINIQDVLGLECPTIKETRGSVAALEPRYSLFTSAPNSSDIPRMNITSGSMQLRCDQSRSNGKYLRFNVNEMALDLTLIGGAEAGEQGFTVKLFASGSNGIKESSPRRDLSGRRSFDPFVAVALDGAPTVPGAKR